MTLSKPQSLWAALAITLGLAGLHPLGPTLQRVRLVLERGFTSFGGGMAAAYVFLYLLPRLAEGNEAVGRVLEDRIELTPLTDLAVFVVALLGFLVFYALEWAARRSAPGEAEAPRVVFGLQLLFFSLYSALITYTLPLKLRAGVAAAVLFAVAMGLHVIATDRVLQEHFPRSLTSARRWALAGGAVGGWLVAVLVPPTSTLLVNLLTALLGGAILLNVFVDELPPERHSSFAWFTAGLVAYAGLLTAATYLTKLGAA